MADEQNKDLETETSNLENKLNIENEINETKREEILELTSKALNKSHDELIQIYKDYLLTHGMPASEIEKKADGHKIIKVSNTYKDFEAVMGHHEIDLDAWQAAMAEIEPQKAEQLKTGLAEIDAKARQRAKDDLGIDFDYLDKLHTFSSWLLDENQEINQEINQVIPAVKEIAKKTVSTSKNALEIFVNAIVNGTDFIDNLVNAINGINSLYHNIAAAKELLDKEIKKPKYKGLALEELTKQAFDENKQKIPGALFWQAIDAVKDQLDETTISLLSFPILAFNIQQFGMTETQETANKQNLSPITKPTHYSLLNSKPVYNYMSMQELLTRIDNDGQLTFLPLNEPANKLELVVRNKTPKRNEVVDIVSLTYSGDLDGKTAKIKGYDQAIYNSISSLVQAGNKVFWIDDIYKTLTQKQKVTDAQIDRIERSMQKFSGTRIRLDVSQEIKNGMITDIDGERISNGILEDALLNYRTLTITTEKGTLKKAIEILDEPILLYYSGIKDQIISIPVDMLELPGRATEEAISIRDYLLREINQLKKGYRNNNTINIKTLFDYIGKSEDTMTRTEKSRLTTTICDILDTYREKKYIKKYDVKTKGKNHVVVGFTIQVKDME